MERQSDKISARLDDEMKEELGGELNAGGTARAQEWHELEPPADDDPLLANRPVSPPDQTEAEAAAEELRVELAKVLGRTSFPADRETLAGVLEEHYAADQLREAVDSLPAHREYRNIQDVIDTLQEQEPPA